MNVCIDSLNIQCLFLRFLIFIYDFLNSVNKESEGFSYREIEGLEVGMVEVSSKLARCLILPLNNNREGNASDQLQDHTYDEIPLLLSHGQIAHFYYFLYYVVQFTKIIKKKLLVLI